MSEMNKVSYERETDRKTEGVRDRWSEGEREGGIWKREGRETNRQTERKDDRRQTERDNCIILVNFSVS